MAATCEAEPPNEYEALYKGAMNDATRDTLRAVFAGHAPTDRELRDLAAALQVPYLELWALAGETVDRPTLRGADVEEWLAWRERDREHHDTGTRPARHRTGE